jgi:hypothetical protein
MHDALANALVAFGMEISEYRLVPAVGAHPVAGEEDA